MLSDAVAEHPTSTPHIDGKPMCRCDRGWQNEKKNPPRGSSYNTSMELGLKIIHEKITNMWYGVDTLTGPSRTVSEGSKEDP